METSWQWPGGGERVAVISSRCGRPGPQLVPWLIALRLAVGTAALGGNRLITATGTTTHRWVVRASCLWSVPRVELVLPAGGRRVMADWPAGLHGWRASVAGPLVECWLPGGDSSISCKTSDSRIPLRDALLVTLADRLVVLRLKPWGNIWSLVMARLRDRVWPPSTLTLAVGPGLISDSVAGPLLELGASAWEVPCQPPLGSARPAFESARTGSSPPVSVPADEGRWLTHCTRAAQGAWPGQSEDDYLDDWLLRPAAADYSAEAALRRIVTQRRLAASSSGIRGGYRVVSFTEVPPAGLVELRTYRRHRTRYDFEPYGLAICREWLERRGVRPARYGDQRLWAELAEDERPFFQCRATRGGSTQRAVDWTREREWRHVGDLSLADLPADAAILLLPDEQAACRLAGCSPWPTAILASSAVASTV
ncbi:MAG: hypothetical protein J5I93_03395 [Pirellulaceae bacterium]|nr:hypothetical protein [Pirellulaceae bacterium]